LPADLCINKIKRNFNSVAAAAAANAGLSNSPTSCNPTDGDGVEQTAIKVGFFYLIIKLNIFLLIKKLNYRSH